ncbi:thiamine-phosphate kinase [Aestuariispira insulae]|uniref:Thiamine-monophosphate kinase n=1 Tax=Aestuariispira insulae TaxID=1461337 RepID=A0A3D9HVF9_9PROT|nr:thiamine-phosphate kinase [Aestuariispira insulae]RED53371.1 thiamine-phosphate kinase [Aestuariispira insulae]
MTDKTSGGSHPEKCASLGEFGRIREFLAPLTLGHPDSLNLRDDAALLTVPEGDDLVVTTDTIVRHVHFLAKDGPGDIASKLMRVNLSDLAAKGAAPLGYSLSLALPVSVDDGWVRAFAERLAEEQATFGIRLIGGDSVRTEGPEVLTINAYGLIPKGQMMRRDGAKAGDLVYVTGTIGDGALGLMAARGDFIGLPGAAELVRRYQIPEPRLALGEGVRGLVNGAMDVSDGLVGDLAAMAGTSGLGAVLHSHLIPLSDPASELLAGDPDLMISVLTGGDDYELLLTVAAENKAAFERKAEATGIPVTAIGEITAAYTSGMVAVLDADGNRVNLDNLKYTHI